MEKSAVEEIRQRIPQVGKSTEGGWNKINQIPE
jgi:hypothetical protein